MALTVLCVLGKDIPDVTGLTAFRVIFQKIKAFFSKLACTTGNSFGVRMGGSLLASDDHPEIRESAFLDIVQDCGESSESISLLLVI